MNANLEEAANIATEYLSSKDMFPFLLFASGQLLLLSVAVSPGRAYARSRHTIFSLATHAAPTPV